MKQAFTTVYILLLGLLTLACHQQADLQPATQETQPANAIAAIRTQFPNAENMLFTSLGTNTLWQVSFAQRNTQYTAATSGQKLLVAYQLKSPTQPDSLVSLIKSTVVDGGAFSNFREQDYSWYNDLANNGKRILADYDWQNTRYTFRWGITTINGNITYVTEVLPFYQLEYRTESVDDLPAPVKQAMANQYLEFSYALVQVDAQGRKRCTVYVRQNNNPFELVYDNEGVLLQASNLQNPQYLNQIDQLPASIQTYLHNTPELAGFALQGQFALLSKSNFGSLQTYRVNLQKGRQTWFMTFDSNGQLISRAYLNLVSNG
ncbi:hypothetical protein GO730_25435 [Spirosoma sp. HMF3257]|uniref:PepSY domain-containing protein n=1 Tax=Spirosoma telluris TaxID=2183553 RepID=A0A327NN86_9BACT|nr:hypothetical protein [Spirosoma telluris]RAI76667.1 hypothetical protein HMF3257_25370 [Spirosoma telluris]